MISLLYFIALQCSLNNARYAPQKESVPISLKQLIVFFACSSNEENSESLRSGTYEPSTLLRPHGFAPIHFSGGIPNFSSDELCTLEKNLSILLP